MNDKIPFITWHRMTREAHVEQKLLFQVVVAAVLLLFALFCFLQLIRWLNSEPEARNIRLLWFGLWSTGGGFLLVGIIMLKQVVPQLIR